MDYTVKIIPNDKKPGKVADAELHFTAGVLKDLKLIGFEIWERRTGRDVTFPSRCYSVNGERRTFSLLRPSLHGRRAYDGLEGIILKAYADSLTPDELSDIQLADRQRELDADRDYEDETLGDA